MAKIIYTYTEPSSSKHLGEACKILHKGGTIAYPTDVNWAFGCDPSSKSAFETVRMLKPFHPKEQPFTLLCNSLSMVSSIADLDGFSFSILKKIFPGPFTVLLKRNRALPRLIKDSRKIVGVRIPQSPLLLDLIREYGKPLATTSIPYEYQVKNDIHLLHYGYEVDEIYGHALDLILDLGEPVPAKETTILDLSEGELNIVRQGAGLL